MILGLSSDKYKNSQIILSSGYFSYCQDIPLRWSKGRTISADYRLTDVTMTSSFNH